MTFFKLLRQSPLSARIGMAMVTINVLAAILAPVVCPYGETEVVGDVWLNPNRDNLLGTDHLGRDMFTRLIYGARNSISIALVTTIISCTIGCVTGVFSALIGGFVDQVISRFVDAIMSVPDLIFILMILSIFGSSIPNLILGSLAYIGFTKGPEAAGANALFWILVNAIPASLGVLIAAGHPITAVVAFLTSPLTSLTPVIGVGYVAAFVQAWARPPVVKELENVGSEVSCLVCWWKNRLLRILLVFILSSLGGAAGTYLGAYGIVSTVF